MSKIRVGVLRGGPSSEYDISLKSGAAVLAGLTHQKFEDKYHLYDILIDKAGVWHMHGVPVLPGDVVKHVDVFFNALHGHYGEDGKIQKILDDHSARYTGSGSLASAIGMNKFLAKKLFKNHGIKTPHYLMIENPHSIPEVAATIFRTFPMPAVIKPVSAGSSLGISVARDFAALEPAIREAFRHGEAVLVEEYIQGVEAAVSVLENFRGEELYVLPAVEIHHQRDIFDYEAKYVEAPDQSVKEIVPGNFTDTQKAELSRIARDVHNALELRHYSRTDFIVTPRRGIYAIEVNTLPGLTEASLLPKATTAVGMSLPDLFDHLVTLAHEG